MEKMIVLLMRMEKRLEKIEKILSGSGQDAKGRKHAFGKYKNVYLTKEEYAEFLKECPRAQQVIERLSEYMAQSGRRYYNALAALRQFAREDTAAAQGRPCKTVAIHRYEQRVYTEEDFEDLFVDLGEETE